MGARAFKVEIERFFREQFPSANFGEPDCDDDEDIEDARYFLEGLGAWAPSYWSAEWKIDDRGVTCAHIDFFCRSWTLKTVGHLGQIFWRADHTDSIHLDVYAVLPSRDCCFEKGPARESAFLMFGADGSCGIGVPTKVPSGVSAREVVEKSDTQLVSCFRCNRFSELELVCGCVRTPEVDMPKGFEGYVGKNFP